MRPTAIYGGAFDPIHSGHVTVITVLVAFGYNVLVIPSFNHPFGKQMASFEDRQEMCRRATAHLPHVSISNIEENNVTGRTFDLLPMLRETFPETDFCVVIGEDDALEIENWHRWVDLIKHEKFIVIPRPGWVNDKQAWYKKSPHRYLYFTKTPAAASREVRQSLARGEKPIYLARGIFNYIAEKGLYNFPTPVTNVA